LGLITYIYITMHGSKNVNVYVSLLREADLT